MTIITEPYVPSCPAVVEINFVPANTLRQPPRKLQYKPLLIFMFHPLVVVIGFVPVILLGWLGFIFLQYPHSFGMFVYFAYICLPFLVQICTALVRGRHAYWYLKYGVHGVAKIKREPVGIEVIDASTNMKVCDLGLRALQAIPEEHEEPIVLYNPARPTQYLSLIAYTATFSVHFDTIRARYSYQVALSVFTACALVLEALVVVTAPFWSGMTMVPL